MFDFTRYFSIIERYFFMDFPLKKTFVQDFYTRE